jgi:hypothetical protein
VAAPSLSQPASIGTACTWHECCCATSRPPCPLGQHGVGQCNTGHPANSTGGPTSGSCLIHCSTRELVQSADGITFPAATALHAVSLLPKSQRHNVCLEGAPPGQAVPQQQPHLEGLRPAYELHAVQQTNSQQPMTCPMAPASLAWLHEHTGPALHGTHSVVYTCMYVASRAHQGCEQQHTHCVSYGMSDHNRQPFGP